MIQWRTISTPCEATESAGTVAVAWVRWKERKNRFTRKRDTENCDERLQRRTCRNTQAVSPDSSLDPVFTQITGMWMLVTMCKLMFLHIRLLTVFFLHSSQDSCTFFPPWSTSIGMTSWIGWLTLFPSGVRSTTVCIIPSCPSVSCSMRAIFHMWHGQTSSCSRATSPLLSLCYRSF